MKTAFITGITGQDGSYLCDLLLEKEYVVHGLVRRPETLYTSYLKKHVENPAILNKRLFLHTGSFEDATHLRRLIVKCAPDEFYHLAAQSSPRLSLQLPESTFESVGMATLRLLEILRDMEQPPRFLYAASSEVFGSPPNSPQDELTPVNPQTPYGAAKAFSMQMCKIYRHAYGIQSCSAILYNHESPRRSGQFVTMKIARAAARIKAGLQKRLELGDINGRRDWGWAPDYVEGMWGMLQLPSVDDFIFATGKLHSVEDILDIAFEYVGLNWKDYTDFEEHLKTTVEPIALVGNPAKAQRVLNWECRHSFSEIIQSLVSNEQQNIVGASV